MNLIFHKRLGDFFLEISAIVAHFFPLSLLFTLSSKDSHKPSSFKEKKLFVQFDLSDVDF
jgi:hypothetical protein